MDEYLHGHEAYGSSGCQSCLDGVTVTSRMQEKWSLDGFCPKFSCL